MADYTPPEIASLMGLVDTHLRWSNLQSQGDRKYIHYHPSEWGKCLRQQQYKHFVQLGIVKAEKESLAGQQVRLFDKGHNMHHRWQDWYFAKMGILRGRWKCKNMFCFAFDNEGKERFDKLTPDHYEKMYSGKSRVYGCDDPIGCFCPEKCACGCSQFEYCETPVFSEELNLSGHCDIILDFSHFDPKKYDGVRNSFNNEVFPKKHIIVDMKTINDFQWKNNLMKFGPDRSYLIQLTIYVHLLDAEYGVLIYENKNDSSAAAYKVERNDDVFNAVKEQAKIMIALAEKKLLPPPKPNEKDSKDCKYCEFSSICHASKIWQDPELNDKRRKFYKSLL